MTYARSDNAATSTFLNVRFNNDAATPNYDYQTLRGNAASVVATESLGLTTSMFAGSIPAASASANLFGVTITLIPHYAGSSNNKIALSVNAFKTGTATTNMTNFLVGGFWRSNAAINQITLFSTSGNFVAGTRVSIYGMGA